MEEEPSRRFFSPVSFLVGFGAGSLIGVLLAILAIVIVQDSDASDNAPSQILVATSTPVPGATSTPDLRPRTRSALDVRLGPGEAFAIIGTVARGEAVEVVGRDSDANWAAVRFPPGSTGRGWLPLEQIVGLTNLSEFSILLPTPLPRSISTPFSSSGFGGGFNGSGSNNGGSGVSTPRPPTATPPNTGPFDLTVTRVSVLDDGRVSVVIGNRGPGDFFAQLVFVLVRSTTGESEQIVGEVGRLAVGATMTLHTAHFRIAGTRDIDAVVDPSASTGDTDPSNNTMRVTLIAPTPTPEPTRPPRD
jgi:hypothetical protein